MNRHKQSLLVRVISEKMFPFLLMFGVYIIFHGSLSPGGGFQGGVVIGAAYILFGIGIDSREGRRQVPDLKMRILQCFGVIGYAAIGLIGILSGYSFLANRVAGIPPMGEPGSLLSGGSLMGINIAIGINVACTIIVLFYAFLECDSGEESDGKEEP